MIQYKCAKCGATLESPSSMAGQEDKCPLCGQKCIVPRREGEKPSLESKSRRTMNARQKAVLLIGILVIVAMCLRPPWALYTPDGKAFLRGYAWILPYPPEEVKLGDGTWAGMENPRHPPFFRIDKGRLALQISPVVALAGFLFWVLGRRRP